MVELISFANAEELANAAATAWLEELAVVNRTGKPHCVALSGGRIARDFFSAIAKHAKKNAVSFERVHFFWADERCVPPTDSESNYVIARQLLFEPLGIPDTQVHRVRGENTPGEAAAMAEEDIRRFAPPDPNRQPMLDLAFLGMGPDGHTASLFPGEPESLISSKAVYRAVHNSPKPPPNRVTLGYMALAAARRVWVLASGEGKEAALRESLSDAAATPLGRLLKLRTQSKVFTDVMLN